MRRSHLPQEDAESALGAVASLPREADSGRPLPVPGVQLAAPPWLGHLPVAGAASLPLHHPGRDQGLVQGIIRDFRHSVGPTPDSPDNPAHAQTLGFVRSPCSRRPEPAEKC